MRCLQVMNNLASRPIVALLTMVMIVFCIMCFTACDSETRKEVFPNVARRASHITYVKDPRTNLCFAFSYVWSGQGVSSDVFANVPCTPEVESLLEKE